MTADHWKFMAEDMPNDPVDMIEDLTKMGIYKPDTFKMADAVNAADIRKALLVTYSHTDSLSSVWASCQLHPTVRILGKLY
ncbi:hypothetical protein [Moorena sp. SIO4G3]|uniref:hypothetical protein n=1 Tax=Moorena sp. SIO4G3 TaxID=2607821 RepID=UPI0025D6DA4D|nr:hypothetical protein [Moorena sp. SIO4G3]